MTEPQTVSQSTDLPPFSGSTERVPDETSNRFDPAKAGPSPYDDPAFRREHEKGIEAQIEGWQKDWSVRVDALMAALGLSRPEVMTYLLLLQMGKLLGLASGFQDMWNAQPAQRRRAMQDKLLELELDKFGVVAAQDAADQEPPPALPPDEAAKQAAKGWRIP